MEEQSKSSRVVMVAENHFKNGNIPKIHKSRKNFLTVACLALLVIFGGCGKEKEEKNKPFRYDKVNIGNAKYLIGSGQLSKSMAKSSSDSYGFHKITENGKIEPIRFIDEQGDTISHDIHIQHIAVVNSDFLFFFGYFPYVDENGYMLDYKTLLANKKTEKIYAVPEIAINFYSGCITNFFTDAEGNIYIVTDCIKYFTEQQFIHKINTVENTIEMLPFGDNEEVSMQTVMIDRNGICLYESGTGWRYRHTSNWFRIVPMVEFGAPILGNDGYIYILGNSNLYRIDEAANNDVKATLLSNHNYDGTPYYNHFNNNLMIISRVVNELYEYNISGNSWRSFPLSALINNRPLVAKNFFYFDMTNVKFTGLDLRTYEVRDITTTLSGYEIRGVSTSLHSDDINFAGMRFSDSRQVAGRIDASGNVTIISESGDNNIRIESLIQLN